MIVGKAAEGDLRGVVVADIQGGPGEVLGGPEVTKAIPAVDRERGTDLEGEAAEVEGVVVAPPVKSRIESPAILRIPMLTMELPEIRRVALSARVKVPSWSLPPVVPTVPKV